MATIDVYDAAGNLVDVYPPTVPDPANGNTPTRPHWHYAYDANGREVLQRDPESHPAVFTFNDLGQQVQRLLPDGSAESWTYDSLLPKPLRGQPRNGTVQSCHEFVRSGGGVGPTVNRQFFQERDGGIFIAAVAVVQHYCDLARCGGCEQ